MTPRSSCSAERPAASFAAFVERPQPTVRALVDLVHRLGRLGEDLHAVKELDLNPVIAQVDGCVVVDSRVRVQRQERLARLKSW